MKVYVIGRDNSGWALDTCVRMASQSIQQFAEISETPRKCDYVHSMSPLADYRKYRLETYVAVFTGNPIRFFQNDPDFLQACRNGIVCVAQSQEALRELEKAKIPRYFYAPDIADFENFYPLEEDRDSIRKKYDIPNDKMIIGSFMRDSLGADLDTPKPEKGADIFCQILDGVAKNIGHDKLCVLLAGPRRHWIRKRLSELGISYVYVGKNMKEDDYEVNILNFEVMNELTNACDLVLVSSRSEGGPKAVMETATAEVPIISSDVGMARELLSDDAVYHSILEAQKMIIEHYKTGYLTKVSHGQKEMVKKMCSVESVASRYKEIYSEIGIVKGKKTRFAIPKKYLKNTNKSIGIAGYRETDVFSKALHDIVQEMGMGVCLNEEIKKVDVLVCMPWVESAELKGIHYKKKYVYCLPNISNEVSYAKDIDSCDGMIFLNRETWHRYLETENPIGKEIVLSNYISPIQKERQTVNVLLAQADNILQKLLEENVSTVKVDVLQKRADALATIEKADVYVANCDAEADVFATSAVLHYGIITTYVDTVGNRKTFGTQAFGYDSLSECMENVKYICANMESVKSLFVSKSKKEIADRLLEVL